jgi:26S proteasome regulatory subunit N1
MAKESGRPTAADKGKGKVDDRELNGEKKHARDEKTVLDGKKDGKKEEEPREGKQLPGHNFFAVLRVLRFRC